MGTLSHPVALPLRKAFRHTPSSSYPRTSSSVTRFSRFRLASADGRWNFAPRKFSHSLSSCAVVVIGRPSAPFDGLQLVRLSLWASIRVSFVTGRMLPTDSASSMSSSTLCTYCLKSSRLDTAIARVDSRRSCSLILLKFLRRSSNNSFVRWLMAVLGDRLPDTQAGFRPARGCRDNVCALRWFIDMVLREGRQSVVTFIDYSVAFDTESQLFLDSALAEAGVNSKVRRIVQAIFAAATGVVRIRQQDGGVEMSEPFNIERGVLQGGYLLTRMLHHMARSYIQAIRSREPWHDSRHGCAHRPYCEV